MLKKIFLFLSLALLGCGGGGDRYERIDRLRPVLVEVNPGPTHQAALSDADVQLDFHFISSDLTRSLTAQVVAPLAAVSRFEEAGVTSIDVQDYPGLRHFVVHVHVKVPALDPGPAQKLAYALEASDGNKTLRVEGDFLAFASADDPLAAWNVKATEIIEPTVDQAVSLPRKINVKADISNPQNEAVRVGWLVSDGEVINRRDADTEWEVPGPGAYTLVYTVRGQASRTAAIRILPVTVQ